MTTNNEQENIIKITKILMENDEFLLNCDYIISCYNYYCTSNNKILPITIDNRIFTNLALKTLGYKQTKNNPYHKLTLN
jgi:hypothetical protein